MTSLMLSTSTHAQKRRGLRRLSMILVLALCSSSLFMPPAQPWAAAPTDRLVAGRSGEALIGSGAGAAYQIDPNWQSPPPRTIRGVKWLDLNSNARREPEEPGLPGFTIILKAVRGRETRKATTGPAGTFQFTQVKPGEYTVSEVPQPGWVQTFPKAAALSVTLRDRGVFVTFGNRPCDEDMARYDRNGNLIVPPGTGPSVPPTDENGNETTGHVSDLYGAYGDTSLDLWYDKFPCQQSLDNGSEPLPPLPDVEAEMAGAGIPSVPSVNQKVNTLGPIIYNTVANAQVFGTLGKVEARAFTPQAPRALNSNQPYSGRDIIYIHGLMPETLKDKLTGSNPQAYTRWPQNQGAFAGNGYWKQAAQFYWSDHISRLYAAGGKNRHLIVAWPSTQRLDVAVHATLTQIARAMNSGTDVVNVFNPSDTAGFCQANCVIVSHSTGALVADVAMAMAQKTKTVPAVANQLGQLGFISDHMKVHVAFQGTFSGSHYATAVQAIALGIGSTDLCPIVSVAFSALTKSNSPIPPNLCSNLASLPDSILTDVVPEVAQGVWGPLVHLTPVPVLTVAGGHPSYYSPLKHIFLRGFDDGVLTANSQCANPLPPAIWPSGYLPVPSPLNVKVYDRGTSSVRANRYFIDQMLDKHWAPTSLPPSLAAGTCTPFISPTGMLQPFAGGLDSLQRYNKHYSFIQSASDHMIGPVGPYSQGGCKNRDYRITAGSYPNNEEQRVITNSVVYQADARFAGDPQPLVNSSMKTAVIEYKKYKRKRILSFNNNNPKYLYIWRRFYHLLEGYECMDEVDYVHQYVVR